MFYKKKNNKDENKKNKMTETQKLILFTASLVTVLFWAYIVLEETRGERISRKAYKHSVQQKSSHVIAETTNNQPGDLT